jgi:prepilin signal peptidase PulO-like enzyme (type II secretory pathway)
MIALMAVVGGFVALHGFAVSLLAVGAVTAFALTGCWYCDLVRGIVPDYFTLFPLGFILVLAGLQGEWRVFVSAFVPFVPFALAALLSGGRGMGWGDAKLVAFGGAVLGVPLALLACTLACFAAGVVSRLAGRPAEPIAFAPYLVVASALALALGTYM